MKYSDMQKDMELIKKHFDFTDYEITRLSMIEFKHYYDQATKLEKGSDKMITYQFDEDVFYYDVESQKLTDKLVELYKEDCAVEPNDIEEEVLENFDMLFKQFEDELKDAFYDEAYEEYKDMLEYQKNPSRYFGV